MSQTTTMRTDTAPAVDIDSIALRAATAIMALPAAGNLPGGAAQLKAKIQCAVYDALEEYRPAVAATKVKPISQGPDGFTEFVELYSLISHMQVPDERYGVITRAAAAIKRMEDGPPVATTEAAAKAVYRLFPGAEAHPWVEGGNSHKQDDARRFARAAIAALPPTIQHQALVTNIVFRAGEMRLKFDDEVPQEFEAGDRVTIVREIGAAS